MAIPCVSINEVLYDDGRSLPQGSEAVHAQLRQLAAIVCKSLQVARFIPSYFRMRRMIHNTSGANGAVNSRTQRKRWRISC